MAAALHRLEVVEALEGEERPRRAMRVRKSPFNLEEKKFVKLYRVTKDVGRELIENLTPFLGEASRSSALSAETKVLAALRFFAGGPYQSYVGGDEYTCMDQSSVSRCIADVTRCINTHLFDRWVTLDLSPINVANLKQGFYERWGFPGVIGAIDCTHVAVIAPPVNHPQYIERQYYNHKRYHSINVQLVCDYNMKILNVNARYPGATHDAFIYTNSDLRRGLIEMQQRYNNSAWLIGDSGYPLETILMTPVTGEVFPHSPEERYNRALCRARNIVERCNGLLKNRWRCLLKHRVLNYMPEKASAIIQACCVLHNMCVDRHVPVMEDHECNDVEMGIHHPPPVHHQDNHLGRVTRQNIIRRYFAN